MQALSGQVAIVTGASKGMGREFVAALVAAGMRVACVARASAELDSLATEHAETVLTLPCDVSVSTEASEAVQKAARHFGRIDAVINNAAIYHPFSFEHASDDIIRNHIDVNVLGVAWMIRAAIPYLRSTQGQIMTVSSESVRLPFPMLALYAATKAAVETLSEGLREELRSDGIRVGILRSGSVSGGSGGTTWSEETRNAFFAKILETGHAAMTGSPATPQSMAQALVSALSLPRDISIDLIEVRAAKAGLPEGAQALVAEADA